MKNSPLKKAADLQQKAEHGTTALLAAISKRLSQEKLNLDQKQLKDAKVFVLDQEVGQENEEKLLVADGNAKSHPSFLTQIIDKDHPKQVF